LCKRNICVLGRNIQDIFNGLGHSARVISSIGQLLAIQGRTTITSVDHKGVTCYGLRGRGVESRSLMTSEGDLSGKSERSRMNSNTEAR